MTLIYAERCDDLIFVISDTFWERPLLGKSKEWRMEPSAKIINFERMTVGFAGNIEIAIAGLKAIQGKEPAESWKLLLAIHQSSNQATDFVFVDHKAFILSLISGGRIKEVQNCHIGSSTGFAEFQRLRIVGDTPSEHPVTTLGVVRMPDNISETAATRYSMSLNRFHECLNSGMVAEPDWGGFAVPWYLTTGENRYGDYLSVARSPIDSVEISPQGVSNIPLNDRIFGGHQLGFTGSSGGFAAHFIRGGFGFIYRGFEQSGVELEKHIGINPYDFALLADGIDCFSFGIWRNVTNDTIQLYNFVGVKNSDGIAFLLKFREDELLGRIRNAGGEAVDFSQGILPGLERAGKFVSNLETIDWITFVIQARLELAKLSGDSKKEAVAFSEMVIWRSSIGEIKLEIEFSFPKRES